ncbi:hypothetical protein Tco_0916053, partial [Tanacetum coccineum]
SISQIEAEIDEEEIRLHETHENLVSTKLIGVDEFDEFDGEPANRPTEEEDHLVLLSEILQIKEALRLQQHTGDSSEGVGITPKVLDELTRKTSSEGASIVLEVLDDGKGSSATKVDTEIDLGSEDDSHQSDDEYVNEGDILSTNEEEKGNKDDDEENNDRSIDIQETDDERTNSENGDQAMNDEEKNVVEKEEEEKGDEEEEQADDDQAQEDQVEDDIVGTLVTMSQKKKSKVPRSSSNHSLSSNYDIEINSLLDVQIQQEIPSILSDPLLDVLVSVIPPPTTTTTTPIPLTIPLPTPPITITTQPVTSPLPATEAPDALGPPSKALTAVLQRVSTLEKDVKKLKHVDHTAVIVESIRSQVPSVLNEFLPSVVSEFLGTSLGDSLQKYSRNILKNSSKNLSSKNLINVFQRLSRLSKSMHPSRNGQSTRQHRLIKL